MKRLNLKLVLVLALVTLLLGVAVPLLHGFQEKRSAGALLDQATKARAAGELGRALDFLQRYLAFRPDDTDALATFGLLLDDLARTSAARSRAFLLLEQVLRRDPGREDVRRRLVRVSMQLERYSEALVHLARLREAARDDADLESLTARCCEGIGAYADAAAFFEAAARHQPDGVEHFEQLARVLRRRLDEPQRADQVMDDMIRQNSASFAAYLSRARYRRELGLLESAAADIGRALELAPDHLEVLLSAAELASAEAVSEDRPSDAAAAPSALEKARSYLARAIDQYPADARAYVMLSRLELRDGDAARAIACIRRGIQQIPGGTDLLWALAELLIEQNELDEAGATIALLRQARFSPDLLDYLEARTLMRRQEWLAASRVLDRIRPRLVGKPELAKQADLQLAQCHEQLGNPDLQLAACRRAVATDPLWVPGRIALGAALLAVGRIDEALAEYRQMMNLPNAPEFGWRRDVAWSTVARVLFLKNARSPRSPSSWQQVDAALQQAEAAAPGSCEVRLLRAELLGAQGQWDAARNLLDALCQEYSDRVEIWVARAALAGREAGDAAALEILDKAGTALGDLADLRLARAWYWMRQGRERSQEKLRELERGADTLPRLEMLRLWSGLADAHVFLGDLEEAKRLYGRVAEEEPSNLHAQLVLFDLSMQSGDLPAMDRAISQVRKIEGEEAPLARYGEAIRLLVLAAGGAGNGSTDKTVGPLIRPAAPVRSTGATEDVPARQALSDEQREPLRTAARVLEEVERQRPTWSRVPLAQAHLRELEGNEDGAIERYTRSVELGESRPRVIRRLIELLYGRGRYREADQVVRHLEEFSRLPDDLGRLATEISLRAEDKGRALELARQAVSAESPDYRDQLWRGRVMSALGHRDEAAAAFQKAIELNEQAGEVWLALVQFLVQADRQADAEAAIEQARLKLPPEASASVLAQCYEWAGRRDQAEREYRIALERNPADPLALRGVAAFFMNTAELRTAEPYLRRLADLPPGTADGERFWARRNLALVLVGTRPDEQRFAEALGLIDENARSAPGNIEDQRTKAAVLAARPSRRQDAIRILTDLVERRAARNEDRFLLAQLYEAVGDWSRAREQLLNLLAADSDNPLYVARYARALLNRGQHNEAELWIANLERTAPRKAETFELRARLLVVQGKTEAAASLLSQLATEEPKRALFAASLLEELGVHGVAETLYRDCLSRAYQPEVALALARCVARQGRLDEALDLCGEAWEKTLPERVAQACVDVLYAAGHPEPSHCQRVERWLVAAAAEKRDSLEFVLALASLQGLQARYPEMERLYRSVLEREPRNLVALNNLAWLIALRGDPHEALLLINRAIEIAGPSPGSLDTRATVYVALGMHDRAVADLNDSLAISTDGSRYLHLARAYQLGQKRDAALAALRQAQQAGIHLERMHPLERPTYDKLLAELGR